MSLILPSDNVDISTFPESAERSAAADENKPGWKSNAFAAAKLLLRGVRDSADAFGPLKSAVGGLCFILENYEVWFSRSTAFEAHKYNSELRQISKR